MMVAAAAASLVGFRSKVKVLEVVNWPDGDTVTVGGEQMFQSNLKRWFWF